MTSTETIIGPLVEVAVEGSSAPAPQSAVSWAAVLAGAFVAGATSLVLLSLGSGLGLASASPWSGRAPSATTFTVMAGIWLIVMQWASSFVGGYITGRLRTRWTALHTHEVFFRDTAHGFLTWAVSTVIVALLAIGAAYVATDATAPAAAGPLAYNVDTLFRSAHPDERVSAPVVRAEAARILAVGTAKGGVPPEDRLYLANLVVDRTGIPAADAQQRVDIAVVQAQIAADNARKAASATSIFTALAMLIGAFIACVAAALGGQQRDEHL